MIKAFTPVCVALTAIVMLSGCSQGIKKTLGLQRNTPDEFAVVERAPLTLPPNYDLVPPKPGADRPQESTPVNTARGLVLRSEPNAAKALPGVSSGENALLNKAGATSADPNIRTELTQQKNLNVDQNKPVMEKLGLTGSSEQGKALNAADEAKRLQQKNIKAPQPVAATKTSAPQN